MYYYNEYPESKHYDIFKGRESNWCCCLLEHNMQRSNTNKDTKIVTLETILTDTSLGQAIVDSLKSSASKVFLKEMISSLCQDWLSQYPSIKPPTEISINK